MRCLLLTEIKIIIKSFSDVEKAIEQNTKDCKKINRAFTEEPYEVYIDGEKQKNVRRFAIDLPMDGWGKDGKYILDRTGWKYILEKDIDCL